MGHGYQKTLVRKNESLERLFYIIALSTALSAGALFESSSRLVWTLRLLLRLIRKQSIEKASTNAALIPILIRPDTVGDITPKELK